MKKDTSWGNVAEWYSDHVERDDNYHRNVILPNLTRLLGIQKDTKIELLDLACGSGEFVKDGNIFKVGENNLGGRDGRAGGIFDG